MVLEANLVSRTCDLKTREDAEIAAEPIFPEWLMANDCARLATNRGPTRMPEPR